MTTDPAAHWQRFGLTDPYFAVLTEERFHTSTLSGEGLEEFFATGEHDVEVLFDAIRAQLDPEFQPRRALDFGCGVGRLTVPLAKRVPRVVGIDVAESMLELARKHSARAGIQNVEFLRSDPNLTKLGTFDFINSFIVFQHIPVRSGLELIQTLVELLEPGGVAALHVTYARSGSGVQRFARWLRAHVPLVNNMVNLMRGKPFSAPYMQTNVYPLNEVMGILHNAGCRRIATMFTEHGDLKGVVLIALKQSAVSSQ